MPRKHYGEKRVYLISGLGKLDVPNMQEWNQTLISHHNMLQFGAVTQLCCGSQQHWLTTLLHSPPWALWHLTSLRFSQSTIEHSWGYSCWHIPAVLGDPLSNGQPRFKEVPVALPNSATVWPRVQFFPLPHCPLTWNVVYGLKALPVHLSFTGVSSNESI